MPPQTGSTMVAGDPPTSAPTSNRRPSGRQPLFDPDRRTDAFDPAPRASASEPVASGLPGEQRVTDGVDDTDVDADVDPLLNEIVVTVSDRLRR